MFTYKKHPRVALYMPRSTACRLLTLLPVLLLACSPAFAQSPFDVPGSLAKTPPEQIKFLDEVIRQDITYFAYYAAALGDINGDGYDDFAVSSGADSTFIFLGGAPVPSHEYSWVLRGGSSGVRSADFNRDGKMDIVTSITCIPPGDWDKQLRGAIRIYLQKEGPTSFIWEEDMLLEGDSGMYLAGEPVDQLHGGVEILDFNCDGWPDVLTKQVDTRDSATQKAVLFFGGPDGFAARPDVEIGLRRFMGRTNSYARFMRVGDFNGDGCDEILLRGTWPSPSGRVDYWDLFLGNAEGRAGEADRVLRSDTGWWPSQASDVMDIDGDGYCDIIDNTLSKPFDYHMYGNIQVFRGGPILPDIILPNDSILNLNPIDEYGDRSATCIEPIGDMNGDGTPDLLINWNDSSAPSYFYYPGGRAFRDPIGYFGTISSLNFVTGFVTALGDVNGDGYDEVMQLGHGSKHNTNCRYYIWKGSPKLRPRPNAVTPIAPSTTYLTLSPNPLPSSTRLQLDAAGLGPGTAMLTVTDLLGRTQFTAQIPTVDGAVRYALDTSGFAPGVYLIYLQQGSTQLSTNCVVY